MAQVLTEEQLDKLAGDIAMLKRNKNPSKEIQILAVKKNPASLQYINNPCIEAQLIAARWRPHTIQYIKDPSEEVQLVAVRADGTAITYIENPTEKAQMAAIKNSPHAIHFIGTEKLHLSVQSQIIQDYPGFARKYIHKFSEEMKALIKLLYN